jgi:glycosyltransferase involved in cell wall biosynthesis
MRCLIRRFPSRGRPTLRRDILILCQLPPPVHGVTVINQQVVDALSRRGEFHIVHLIVGSATSLGDIGRYRFSKIIELGATLFSLLRRRLGKGVAAVAYLSFSPIGPASLRDALLAGLGRLAANRVLVHVHGEGFGELTGSRSLRARLIRAMVSGCEVIAITQRTADVAAHSGLFRRVWQVPNGIADPGLPAEKPRSARLQIAYVANMQPGKGIDLLLGALRKLADSAVDFRAHLIGDGTALLTLSEVRRRIEQLRLMRHVTVHGPLYGDDKFRILAQAHLFAYPSRHDHAPLVLLEAMALGLVPIVLDTGGIAEIVGPELAENVLTGTALDNKLELLLARRMAYYDAHRDLISAHGSIARRRYLAQYTTGHFSARLMNVFSEEGKATAARSKGHKV